MCDIPSQSAASSSRPNSTYDQVRSGDHIFVRSENFFFEPETVHFQVCRDEPSVVAEPQCRPAFIERGATIQKTLWYTGLLGPVTPRSNATTTVTHNLGACLESGPGTAEDKSTDHSIKRLHREFFVLLDTFHFLQERDSPVHTFDRSSGRAEPARNPSGDLAATARTPGVRDNPSRYRLTTLTRARFDPASPLLFLGVSSGRLLEVESILKTRRKLLGRCLRRQEEHVHG